MPETSKFDFREWLAPPLPVPIFFGRRIAAVVVLGR
jgi:hypothetical protein